MCDCGAEGGTEGDAEAPASAEGKEDVEKDRQGEDKEKGDGSEDSDEGTRSKSRSPTGSNQQADNNAAAPTRRCERAPSELAHALSFSLGLPAIPLGALV